MEIIAETCPIRKNHSGTTRSIGLLIHKAMCHSAGSSWRPVSNRHLTLSLSFSGETVSR